MEQGRGGNGRLVIKMTEHYKIVKTLGEGSFGKCYLVEAASDHSKCVIKQVDLNNLSKQEQTESFKEAKILEQLDHPNIIRFREVYKTKKSKLCIVMDFADGGDLGSKIKGQNGRLLTEKYILDLFVQICLAIKHVHDRKIIHRDLKAQNIFLMQNGNVKLGDFGIAKVLAYTMANAQTMVGTPYYLSPEIVQNRPYNFQSDIWSLGVLLYEMCTLRPPFDASNIHSLAMKIIEGRYAPLPNHFSSELRHLVASMLIREPASRPSIHQLLRVPIIRKRIEDNLSRTIGMEEFSHTILHGINILEEQKALPQQNSAQKRPQEAKQPEKQSSAGRADARPQQNVRPSQPTRAVPEPQPAYPVRDLRSADPRSAVADYSKPQADNRRDYRPDYRPPADYRQPPADYRQPPADYRQPPTDYRQPPTDYRQPPTDYRQPPTDYRQPPADYRQQPGEYRQQPGEYRQQPGEYRQQPDYRVAQGEYRGAQADNRGAQADIRGGQVEYRQQPQAPEYRQQPQGDSRPAENRLKMPEPRVEQRRSPTSALKNPSGQAELRPASAAVNPPPPRQVRNAPVSFFVPFNSETEAAAVAASPKSTEGDRYIAQIQASSNRTEERKALLDDLKQKKQNLLVKKQQRRLEPPRGDQGDIRQQEDVEAYIYEMQQVLLEQDGDEEQVELAAPPTPAEREDREDELVEEPQEQLRGTSGLGRAEELRMRLERELGPTIFYNAYSVILDIDESRHPTSVSEYFFYLKHIMTKQEQDTYVPLIIELIRLENR